MASALTWLGHATVLIETAGLRLLTDPVLRGHVGPLRNTAPRPDPALLGSLDAVLISHLHHDHLDLPSLRLLPADVPLVVPAGSASLFVGDVREGRPVLEVRPGGTVELGGVRVDALPAHHPGARLGSRVRAPALGYLVNRVWFAGDTGPHAAQRELAGAVDVAVVPIGGWGLTLGPHHLDPAQAADVVATVGARAAMPVHWGTLFAAGLRRVRPDRADGAGELFAAALRQCAPAVDLLMAPPGTRVVTA